MYAFKRASLSSIATLILGFILSHSATAQFDVTADAQCSGTTLDQHYIVTISDIPTSGTFEVFINDASVGTTSTGQFTSAEIAFVDGTVTNSIRIEDQADTTNFAEILVHEVLCVDVNQDGNLDFNTAVCDYTKPLGTGGAIVSTVAPYNSANVYLYILTSQDGIYSTATSVSNNSGLFEDLENGDYSVFAFNFLSESEADDFLSGIPDNQDLNSYAPPGEPTCFALCGSADYTVDCESIVDIYVNPVDEEVCMEGDASFFIQDSIIAPVPNNADLTYQWQVDDGSGTFADVGGETDSLITLSDVVFADSGNMYRVIVTLVVDGTDISMDTSGVATLTVFDDPVLASDLSVTVNSDEPSGIVLAADDGSVAADSFDIVSITVGDDLIADPGNASEGLTDDANVIAADMYTNTGDGPDTAFYEIVPISEHGCAGDTLTVFVEVRPCPMVSDLTTVEVCSGEGFTTSLPSSDDNGLTLDSLLVASLPGPNIGGTAFSGLVLPDNLSVITQDTFTNTSDVPDSVVYTVTPYANNCAGESFELIIHVDPEPVFDDVNVSVCSDEEIGVELAFTDDTGLAIESVSITATVGAGLTGTPTEGSDITSTTAISGDVFTNTGTSASSVTYTVTPTTADGCVGQSYEIVVSITPEPVGSDPTPTVCSDELMQVDLSNLITNGSSDVSFTWVAEDNPNVDGEQTTTQSADTINIQITNTTDISQEVVYSVVPTDGATCVGDTFTVTVTVLPEPVFSENSDDVCSDEALDIDLSSSQTNGVDITGYIYTVSSSNESDVPAGSARTDTSSANITDTYTNTTNSDVVIIYTVTPISTSDCAGDAFDVTVTVNPEPVLANLNDTICSDAAIGIILATEGTSIAADSFNILSISPNTLVASAGDPTIGITSDINEIADDAWTNTTSNPVQVIYNVVPITGDCSGDPVNIVVTIDPAAVVELDSDVTLCSTETVDLAGIGASIQGGASSGTWSSSGSGAFDDTAFGTGTTYTPSEADIDAGSITITLTSADPTGSCTEDSASITVSILDIRCSEFPWNGND